VGTAMTFSLIKKLDFSVLLLTALLVGIGIANLYSATRLESLSPMPVYLKQMYWLGLGVIIMVGAALVDYHFFERWGYWIYAANILLLVGLFVFGDRSSGTVRWYTIGPISFQPSEYMKLSLIFALSKYFSGVMTEEGLRLTNLIIPAFIIAVPAALVLKEPDLGSAGLLVLVFLTMVFTVKMRPKTLLSLIVAGAVSVAPAIYFGWNFLKPYQRQRILTFINPNLDPLGSGYHIIQSKIAVGSGGLFGKGFMNGTQGLLKFLPEQHTDFIFAVLAEEWGFVGAVIVVGLFLMLIIRALAVAQEAKDFFGGAVAAGIASFFIWQVFINIGMATGIFPVVGIPLPFLSYGGSSLVASLCAVGLLLNIHRKRKIF
jgi:rod shape determining protein RodA